MWPWSSWYVPRVSPHPGHHKPVDLMEHAGRESRAGGAGVVGGDESRRGRRARRHSRSGPPVERGHRAQPPVDRVPSAHRTTRGVADSPFPRHDGRPCCRCRGSRWKLVVARSSTAPPSPSCRATRSVWSGATAPARPRCSGCSAERSSRPAARSCARAGSATCRRIRASPASSTAAPPSRTCCPVGASTRS